MKLGKYYHHKNPNKEYRILGVAFDTATDSKVVLYQALHEVPDLAEEYGINPVFTRPYDVFFGTVEHEGKTVSRFEYIGE